jgi:hypothetical protein
MCYYCLDKSPETFQHFQGLFPYLDNYAIEKYPHLIKYLKKPTIKHCYLAIKNCLENIRYINNKPKLFKKKIVKLSGVNLQYFREEEIDPEMVKIALENFPKALKYVPKKFVTREMIKDVFNKEPGIILFLSGELINSLAIDQNLHYLYRLFI